MAGTLLTPTLLWKGFSVNDNFCEQVVEGMSDGKFSVRKIYFNGRPVNSGNEVKIFATIIKSEKKKPNNAFIYLQDLGEDADESLMKELAEQGYLVMSVDVCGKKEQGLFTQYPDDISYANYCVAKDNLYSVAGSADQTCWYEWACVLRYALRYLKLNQEIQKVGGIAVGESATALWQVAGMDKHLDLAVFALNAGWAGYRGTDKFGGQVEKQFSDDMYKYVAGVEPQSYAMHVTCPTLILCATNSDKYDCDRVCDTLAHFEEDVFCAVNYSVGNINTINRQAVECVKIFIDNFFENKQLSLVSYIDIKCDCVNGKVQFNVEGQLDGVKEVNVYVAEETIKPSNRCWKKISENKKNENGELVFEYSPYPHSEMLIAFAQATYKNGFTIGSKIIAKRFSAEEVNLAYKSNVIYSSRSANAESVFISAEQGAKNSGSIDNALSPVVKFKKGPMGINGVCCESGLLTFKINAKTDRPQNGAMLMFDLYSEKKGANCVKLIADYFGEKVEYFAWFNVLGGEVWQNVQLEQNKFKTEQGMPLKSYDKIDAIEFSKGDGVYVINNALWV